MRIERISENTIRCTLTNFDLSVRNIKLSELTYGSENARNLFREMMQRAHNEVGFEAEDTPIMVEAIPMANDSIMLIITKVEDPDELDTRFSRFTQDHEEELSMSNLANELLEGADEILNLLGNPDILEQLNKLPTASAPSAPQEKAPAAQTEDDTKPAPQNMRIYQFDTLDLVCAAAKQTGSIFTGESILYKNPGNGKFYLILKKADCDELSFSKTCNALSEYAVRQKYDPATEAYYSEHYELFVKKNSLQVLADL
ncbi:MAG: adaptor protein MecA [Lachnoclostridium sp.]|nr:adaptor protein MecA [Lachnoclostridium sp.]